MYHLLPKDIIITIIENVNEEHEKKHRIKETILDKILSYNIHDCIRIEYVICDKCNAYAIHIVERHSYGYFMYNSYISKTDRWEKQCDTYHRDDDMIMNWCRKCSNVELKSHCKSCVNEVDGRWLCDQHMNTP